MTKKREAPPLWEWIVAFAGLVLVASAIGFLALQALEPAQDAPAPAVEVAAIHPHAGGGHVVRVRVHNHSAATAAGLKVEGTLLRAGQPVEHSEFELPYLPGGSTREGGMFFALDPRSHTLELRPKGYEKP